MEGIIAIVKFLHIAALSLWCAGLIGLPMLLGKHDTEHAQQDYSRLRVLTHRAYSGIVTPAAVIAIAMGTALVYLRGLFVPWMFAKLVGVGILVLIHAWVGHITSLVGEEQGSYEPSRGWPVLTTGISMSAVIVILLLVLGKPHIEDHLAPDWLSEPQGQPLPVDEVPI